MSKDELFIMSHCISCPECGAYPDLLWRSDRGDGLIDVVCCQCGASWLEHDEREIEED